MDAAAGPLLLGVAAAEGCDKAHRTFPQASTQGYCPRRTPGVSALGSTRLGVSRDATGYAQ